MARERLHKEREEEDGEVRQKQKAEAREVARKKEGGTVQGEAVVKDGALLRVEVKTAMAAKTAKIKRMMTAAWVEQESTCRSIW